MAPSVFGQTPPSKEHRTASHKMRKPLVEKLRRDRINRSIEQLRALLGPALLRQQPDSKQEKADVLETTVAFLRGGGQQGAPGGDGYARCVHEAVSFLSRCQAGGSAHARMLGHFQSLQGSGGAPAITSPPASPLPRASKGGESPPGGCLWRPW